MEGSCTTLAYIECTVRIYQYVYPNVSTTVRVSIVSASQILSFAVFSVAEQAAVKERLEEDMRRLQAELDRK